MFYQITDSGGLKTAWVESELLPYYFGQFLNRKGYYILKFQTDLPILKVDTQESLDGLRMNEIEEKVRRYKENRRAQLNIGLEKPMIEEDLSKAGVNVEDYEYLGEFALYGDEPKRYYGRKGYKEKAAMIEQLLKLDVDTYHDKLIAEFPDPFERELSYTFNPMDFDEATR